MGLGVVWVKSPKASISHIRLCNPYELIEREQVEEQIWNLKGAVGTEQISSEHTLRRAGKRKINVVVHIEYEARTKY
jgi:hypothetical protein